MKEPADKELWDEWFSNQYELVDKIKNAIKRLSANFAEGKPRDQFCAALWSSIIETGAEEMRRYLNLDGWKPEEKEEGTTSAV